MAIEEDNISKLKADTRGTDTKLQQMKEGLKWFNKEIEDINWRSSFFKRLKKIYMRCSFMRKPTAERI